VWDGVLDEKLFIPDFIHERKKNSLKGCTLEQSNKILIRFYAIDDQIFRNPMFHNTVSAKKNRDNSTKICESSTIFSDMAEKV
jgi:hypothetical protein